MRSVFCHLRTATDSEVAEFLTQIYPRQKGPPWVEPVGDDPCLYINLYPFEQVVDGPEEREMIVRQLGHNPSVVVMADVSGRHPGDEQVRRFVMVILTEFPGVAQDDYTSHCWTLDEVFQGRLIDGHSFFDYRGWYEAESDHSWQRWSDCG